MGCQDSIIAASINGLIIGAVVGVTLGVVKSIQGEGRGAVDWIKELVPQTVIIGVVIGFSHSMLSACTGFLQHE